MSIIQDNQAAWTNLAGKQLDSKYEKCRNITEEIYKRINITFQIKKLESGEMSEMSDNSEQVDSNELSNETDLFACDKSDISSSTEAERPAAAASQPAIININNNNEERNKSQLDKKPRKRFRKRVKKRPPNQKRCDSEGSSDEAPLSRSIVTQSPDVKVKRHPERKPHKRPTINSKNITLRDLLKPTKIKVPTVLLEKLDKKAMKSAEAIDNESEKSLAAMNKRIAEKFSEVTNKSKSVIQPIDKKTETVVAIDSSKEKKNVEVTIDKEKEVAIVETDKSKFGKDVKITDWKSCSLCNLSFRGERGLRRHMSMSHIEGNK